MRILGPVLFAHYLAAFTALGMPLFMPRVLGVLAPGAPTWLVGTLYVLPTVCTALTATAWGRWADRHGRRLSLLRAQAGLAVGFLIAGFAPNLPVFVAALVIQGTFGGSLAAANAYLATQSKAGTLSRALDWTQYSARLAMVTAPILLGLATRTGLTHELYGYLAVLPCLALLVTSRLPRDVPRVVAPTTAAASTPPVPAITGMPHAGDISPTSVLAGLLAIQFLFCFAMVVTFPYFLPYSEHLGVRDDGVAGWFYSLPHLVYLVAMPWLRRMGTSPLTLLAGLAVLALACVGHAVLTVDTWLPVMRVIYGAGMLLSFVGLNRAMAAQSHERGAGTLFGRFDATGKWAGALGGVVAGSLVARYGLAMPFVAAAITAGVAWLLAVAVYLPATRRNVHVPPRHA
ncbi:MFS family permease [Luteibacter sp. PvP120]